jgi:hypothetical protein
MPRASKRARHCSNISRNRAQNDNPGNESNSLFVDDAEVGLSELEGVVAVDEDADGYADSELQFQNEFSQAVLQLALDRLLKERNPTVQSFLSWNPRNLFMTMARRRVFLRYFKNVD